MIQLGHWGGGTIVRDAAWEATKRTFAERHVVLLPEFVEDSLLRRLARLAAEGEYRDLVHESTGSREAAMDASEPLPTLFWLLLSRPPVFAALQDLVDGCSEIFGPRKDVGDGRIRAFQVGRCFKLMPGSGHRTVWHDDVALGRLIGISVNLADGSVGGGVEVRRRVRGGPAPACHGATPAFGGAALFRVAAGLEHRGLPGHGSVPRCAFTGWFTSQPDTVRFVRRARRPSVEGSQSPACQQT